MKGVGGWATFSGHPGHIRVKSLFNCTQLLYHIEITSLLPGLAQLPIVEILLALLKNGVGARKRESSRASRYGWMNRWSGLLIPNWRTEIIWLK
jgi:hypothetical protein